MKWGQLTLLVREYDEIIAFYCEHVGFALTADTDLGNGHRHVVLTHRLAAGLRLLLLRAYNYEQHKAVGKQAGDYPFLTLPTDDCRRDYERLILQGVRLKYGLTQLPYGMQVILADPYGNWVCLSQRYDSHESSAGAALRSAETHHSG